jgi:hypothetical protein
MNENALILVRPMGLRNENGFASTTDFRIFEKNKRLIALDTFRSNVPIVNVFNFNEIDTTTMIIIASPIRMIYLIH